MLKIEYTIKLLLAAIFIAYVCVQGTLFLAKFNDKLFGTRLEKSPSTVRKNYDYLVVGGSNAMFGISVERITQKTGLNGYNLAMSVEGAGLLNYQEWLEQSNSHARTLIYSSMNLWYFGKTAPFEQIPDATLSKPLKRPLIEVPLIRTIS
ncbi:MAG TPA: hypothetical protein PK129_02550, partial [Cellvibrionaceae bacterium]|nr:hypothetical protein [Cellvibrionaceae bacterium]